MRQLAFAVCLWGLAGCAPTPHFIYAEREDQPSAAGANLTTLLAAHPLPDGENIKAVALGRTEALSYHLVQIRDRERPHIHASHDLIVTLLRGSGQLHIQAAVHEMRAGDVAVVPHGTAHYFVNTGDMPAAAFVTFAPPYDSTDQVPVAQ